MRASESLTTNDSCMIIQKTEMFHWSSSVNKKKQKNPTNPIIIKIKAPLYAINSVWPCLRMLLVYLNLSIMFPSCMWSIWLHRSICCAPILLVTMQHQSIVLRQSPYQRHIISALDTAQAILVSSGQTGTGSAAINLRGVRDRSVLLCLVASSCLVTFLCDIGMATCHEEQK